MGNIDKFDLIAESYDTPERTRVANAVADAIRERLGESKGRTAIDYGCGTGLVGMQLLEDFSSILLVDASVNMVKQVKTKLEKPGIKNAKVRCHDFMTEVPAGLRTDCVILVQVLLHESDVTTLPARLRTVLVDGGRLIIVDFDKNDKVTSSEVHAGFEQKELSCILSKLSFTGIRSETFFYSEKMLMDQAASLFIMTADYNVGKPD
jgi:ubiquinone/menaquinone biosynthesis C-methylase UbiE